MALVDIPRVSLGFVEVAIQAEAEFVAQRTGQAKVSAFGGTFLFMFWRIEISIPGAVPLTTAFFGNDVNHAARRAVAITRSCRTTQNFNTFNHFRWHPGSITTGIALATPALTHRVTAAYRLAVNQNQRVFRTHTANINLSVIPTLTTGGVTGQVNAWHGTDDLRHIAGNRVFADFICGDGRNARRL